MMMMMMMMMMMSYYNLLFGKGEEEKEEKTLGQSPSSAPLHLCCMCVCVQVLTTHKLSHNNICRREREREG